MPSHHPLSQQHVSPLQPGKSSASSPPGHFTDPDRFPPWETSYQFLAVISVRRWKLILERLRLTNSLWAEGRRSVEAVFVLKRGSLLEKEICIWDMLVIFSCWWVDDCWVAWYQYVLPNQIWKWWFRNEHANSIYVCMMYMYLINDSYTQYTYISNTVLRKTANNIRKQQVEVTRNTERSALSNFIPRNYIHAKNIYKKEFNPLGEKWKTFQSTR